MVHVMNDVVQNVGWPLIKVPQDTRQQKDRQVFEKYTACHVLASAIKCPIEKF